MRRKGTPCACECDPCKGKNYVRAVNNVSPDANGDFEIKAGNGIGISQSGDNSITIINQAMASSFVAGNNIDITPVGDDLQISVTDDVSINNLNVAGNIIQQGAAYETHAEKIYTTNDYIYMRDGAVGGLAVGDYSGFQVEKYDGTNDGRLVIDNSGVARVGDVGDEQPLLTREEAADLDNGDLLSWSSSESKAKGIPNTIPVLEDLTATVTIDTARLSVNSFSVMRYGKVVTVYIQAGALLTTENDVPVITGLPEAACGGAMPVIDWSSGTTSQLLVIYPGSTYIRKYGGITSSNIYQTLTYICK